MRDCGRDRVREEKSDYVAMSSRAESQEQRGSIHQRPRVVLGCGDNLRAGEKVRNRDERGWGSKVLTIVPFSLLHESNGHIARHSEESSIRVSPLDAESDEGRFEVIVETASADVHRLGEPCGRTAKKRRPWRRGRDADEPTILMRWVGSGTRCMRPTASMRLSRS